jgi:acetylornithine/succinyldiaminopimelate/putrescine aminotransferase
VPTSATRLFEKGVPEKIIAERTGHKSLVGLHTYEKTTEQQEKAVCSAVAIKDATFLSNNTCSTNATLCQVVQAFSGSEDAKDSKKPDVLSFSGSFHGCTFNLQ